MMVQGPGLFSAAAEASELMMRLSAGGANSV
jgi:hypothetical protein